MRISLRNMRPKRILITLTIATLLVAVGGLLWVYVGGAGPGAGISRTKDAATRPSSVAQSELETHFNTSIRPFLETYCITCHSGADPKAGLNMAAYTTAQDVAADAEELPLFIAKLRSGDMPPAAAKIRPNADERRDALTWFQGVNRLEAQKTAGDPGKVLGHRLSSAEYDYSIRDLTGVDIKPAKEFPIDPANQAGFDNTGESLNMEPELLKKYMEAARFVSEHLVLKTEGIDFAPYPVKAITDRNNYTIGQIMDFYARQNTDLGSYFLAAWRYQNRATLGRPQATLKDFGAELSLSQKYLATIWGALNDKQLNFGPIAALQALWKALPMPDGKPADAAANGCRAMATFVTNLRAKTRPAIAGVNGGGNQVGIIWRNYQYAITRLTYAYGAAAALTSTDLGVGTPAEAAMAVPEDGALLDAYEGAFRRFSAIFPDVFVVKERAAGRLLGAGFHLQTGFYRDDAPISQLLLDEKGQQELERLWRDLNFITDAPVRTLQSFIWFEREEGQLFFKTPEFDFAQPIDPRVGAEPFLSQIRDLSMEKLSENTGVQKALKYYYDTYVGAAARVVDKAHETSAPIHVAALQDFAERAYRRPLSQAEKDDIVSFYQVLRKDNQLDHEEAMRDSIVSILMSPYFCYRVNAPATTEVVQGLDDYELASRLSFFLWSSIPDRELTDRAKAGDLHRPDILKAQTRRMLKDDRIVALATEFGGNWLDFRRFQSHNGVDRDHFTTFDNTLREAMFQEPIRFFIDVVRNDSSVLDFIYGDYTFVNAPLARHYGMPAVNGAGDTWVRVDNAHLFQRGGLLPMGVFLTQNAPGLRTSPVKRGYWLVRRLLGEVIAPPPPNVPTLPTDESKLGDLTLPQLLAKHRENVSCATCHVHFDSEGLSFEGYGPIGELRTLDLGGKPVENTPNFRDGSSGTGLEGLRTYLKANRQDDFLENLCRKLLANALGRTLGLSDDLLVEKMLSDLKSNGYRFNSLVETIVTSPQFLNKRGRDSLARKGE